MLDCVRATTVCLLKAHGVEDRKVCLVTGHKAERSLRSYDKPRDAERKRIADCLDEKAASSVLACKELEVFIGARAGSGCGESSRTDYV